MTKVIELRQNRALIDTNFQGYKLSLDPIATIKQELNIIPIKARPSDEQYSYFHAELFSLHNYLTQDLWNRNDSYFINEIGEIIKCSYDENTGKSKPLYSIYKFENDISNRKNGDFPITLQFISENLCIICNGIDEIQLLDTNDRSKNIKWICIFKHKIEEFKNFIIKDSRLDILNDKKLVNCLLQHISCNNIENNGHINELIHCILELNKEDGNNIWKFSIKNIFMCKGNLNYCAFEVGGNGLIVCSNKEIKSKEELKNKENSQNIENSSNDNLSQNEGNNESVDEDLKNQENSQNVEKSSNDLSQDEANNQTQPVYSWSQTESDITIKFNKSTIDRKNFRVISRDTKLLVKSCDKIILEGNLFEKVDSDVTVYMWKNDNLEIILSKEEENLHWPYLIVDTPSETIDDKKQTDFMNTMFDNRPVADLESQIEECDFPSNFLDEEYTLVRINLNSLKSTHKISLGKNPPLFSTYLDVNNPPAIVVRQDVDACIWSFKQMKEKQENYELNQNDNEFYLHHENNLHAFGYIQASKQQKKFTNCSLNFQYVVICESYRHIFIYKSNYGNDNELRNRNGPQITIGKQYVVTLTNNDDNHSQNIGEILGMSITNNFVVLLTEKNIAYLQIN